MEQYRAESTLEQLGGISDGALEPVQSPTTSEFSFQHSNSLSRKAIFSKRLSLQSILGYSQKLYEQRQPRLNNFSDRDSELDEDSKSITSEMSFCCRGETPTISTSENLAEEDSFEYEGYGHLVDHSLLQSQPDQDYNQLYPASPNESCRSFLESPLPSTSNDPEAHSYEKFRLHQATIGSINSLSCNVLRSTGQSTVSLDSESSFDIVDPELSTGTLRKRPRADSGYKAQNLSPSKVISLFPAKPFSRESNITCVCFGRALKRALKKF
ncbi:hypothetical protein BY996DRAFT_3707473 [Phakopsora pachyrhizi]|uniref:Expressed protein n=1 Tax=Phakopsora pachyrhizi TaxID=170000 RepID=A0AAV0BLV7_PHAPC|nr:hypothetical protein BY996DRAFT_3707473 [Phakopsora pachyrhizi]CAH7686950.1 expressed protein [Phakopsora pachyrhizi]